MERADLVIDAKAVVELKIAETVSKLATDRRPKTPFPAF